VFLGGQVALGAGLWLFTGSGSRSASRCRRSARGAARGGQWRWRAYRRSWVGWLHPLLFPVVGYALVDRLALVQLAGSAGRCSRALVGLLNAALAESLAWLRAERARPLATGPRPCSASPRRGATVRSGSGSSSALPAAPALRVAGAANLGVLEKRRETERPPRAPGADARTGGRARRSQIWPETVYTRGIAGRSRSPASPSRRAALPLLFGAATVEVRRPAAASQLGAAGRWRTA
jgi:hypothetical protein